MMAEPLSANQLLSHPAFESNNWNLQPRKAGYAQVATGRCGGPFPLWYEIYGSGPTLIVWIMGLGSPAEHWKRQTRYFGHEKGDQYTCLVFDSRGIGKTAKPFCWYSTSEIARDVVDLLKHVQWVGSGGHGRKSVNVVGISLGGMVAQELGLLIPGHIQSLSIIASSPRLVRSVPSLSTWKNCFSMLVPVSIDTELERLSQRLFSEEWLNKSDTEYSDASQNFPLNRDRFAADELLSRKQTNFSSKGFFLQAIGASTHNMNKQRLQEMAASVGYGRIAVVHGSLDQFIPFEHFEFFKTAFGDQGIHYRVYDGCGHLPIWERDVEFHAFLEGLLESTRDLNET